VSEIQADSVQSDRIIMRPTVTQTQFQIVSFLPVFTGGQVDWSLPVRSRLGSLVVGKAGIMVTYVREYVNEGTKRDTLKRTERVTIIWSLVDGSWVKGEPIRQTLDVTRWVHEHRGARASHNSDTCSLEVCSHPVCMSLNADLEAIREA
jgi:hypothetical protein